MSLLAELRNRFAFGRLLGSGSYGEVFEVVDQRTGSRLALKHLEIPGDGERERREIAASLRLDHPHVVRCFEGEVRGQEGYLLMELAEGTLAERIRFPSRLPENYRALCQVAAGLAALHANGLVHRDLKPANVLFVEGVAKLADLGLTRDMSLKTVTAEGMILGTPGYLAPEQAVGERATPAVDVYALGILFYEALVGELPYRAHSPLELLRLVARAGPHRLLCSDEVLAPATRRHLEALLVPDPGDRPADLAAWLRELEDLPGPGLVRAEPSRESPTVQLDRRDLGSGRRSLPRTDQRRRAVDRRWRSAAAALVLGAGVAGFLLTDPPPPPPPEATSQPEEAAAPFTTAHIQAIRDRLTDLQAKVVLPDGLLVDPEDPRAERGASFPDADPLQWGSLPLWIPEVARFHRWALEGGDPADIPERIREEMRRTDEYLGSLTLPRLFGPVLDAGPAPATDFLGSLFDPHHDVDLPPAASRLHALAALYAQQTDQTHHVGLAMLDDPEEPFPEGSDLTFLRTWRSFQQREDTRAHRYFENYGSHRPARVAIQPYIRGWGERLRRTAHTLRLEYRVGGPPAVALLGGWIAEQAGVAMHSEALTDPLVIPTGGELEGLPASFVAELLLIRGDVWDEVGLLERGERDVARGLALFREILRGPPPRDPRAKDLRMWAIRRTLWWLRGEDYLEALATLRRHLPLYEGLEGHLADQVQRVVVDAIQGPRSPEETRALIELVDELVPVIRDGQDRPDVAERLRAIEVDLEVLRQQS
jgi:serine/threonine protein kinase